jgi:hypothetical protein
VTSCPFSSGVSEVAAGREANRPCNAAKPEKILNLRLAEHRFADMNFLHDADVKYYQ